MQSGNARSPRLALVLDTNVVLDLLHFRDAAAAPLREALQAEAAICYVDAPCREELARVLRYAQFALGEEDARRILAEYAALARVAAERGEPQPALPRCRDPDDQKFIELAQAVQADLLVTKDKALLRLAGALRRQTGIAVVTPAAAALRLRGR